MLTDAELLRRYAEEKSEAAFAELVSRYVDLVYSAAQRLVGGDAHRAGDVAQVVFTTLARKAAALAHHPVLAGWLYTTTRHAAARALRSEMRRRAREQEAHAMQEILGSGETAIDWARVRPVLDAAMADLGERDREAVLLRYFARRPFAEVAAVLRSSEDAARMRVERALGKLRAALGRRGVTSTEAALGVVLTQHAAVAAPAGFAAQVAGAAIAGSATEVAGFLAFMSTTKMIGVSATALVLLTVGTSVHQIRAERNATDALTAARGELAAQLASVREIERRNETTQQQLVQLQQSLAELQTSAAAEAARPARPSPVAPARSPATSSFPSDPHAAGRELMARFPEVKQALLDRSFARIRARFEPLYQQLQLTPAQIEQFETLMLNNEGMMTSVAGFGTFQLTPGDGRSRGETEQALRALLGSAGYERMLEVGQASAGLQFAAHLAGALYFTDEPLTATQARELGRVVTQFPVRPDGAFLTRDWDGLFAVARPLLSEQQFAALARARVQEEFGASMKARMFSPKP